jgi:DNA modification methylase
MYILNANALHLPLADNTVQACITSPPYWGLRDYGTGDQLGLEPVPDCLGWATGQPCGECYVCRMVQVFREVRRVLRPDGTLWLNLGDSYAGSGGAGGDYNAGGLKEGQPRFEGTGKLVRSKRTARGKGSGRWGGGDTKVPNIPAKNLIGIPWRVALALQADGWYLRSDVIWHKPNPMPESVTDRPTKSHEYFFLLSKSEKYFYDAEAVKEEASSPVEKLVSHHDPENPKYAGAPSERWLDQFDGRTWGKVGTRNRRTVWTIATKPYSGAHFATFPPDLVEIPVLASTSPKACPHCRAPWERVVEVVGREKVRWKEGAAVVDAQWGSVGKTSVIATGEIALKQTTGWQPTCTCLDNDGSGKCLVLDPFSGTATVGRVCLEKGRAYIGTELNRQYIELARERTSRVQVELL